MTVDRGLYYLPNLERLVVQRNVTTKAERLTDHKEMILLLQHHLDPIIRPQIMTLTYVRK